MPLKLSELPIPARTDVHHRWRRAAHHLMIHVLKHLAQVGTGHGHQGWRQGGTSGSPVVGDHPFRSVLGGFGWWWVGFSVSFCFFPTIPPLKGLKLIH